MPLPIQSRTPTSLPGYSGAEDRTGRVNFDSGHHPVASSIPDGGTVLRSLDKWNAFDYSHPKVCTACLTEGGWIRREWEIRTYVACPDHGTILKDTCHRCGYRLTWRRPAVDLCSCKASLWGGEPVAASQALIRISAALCRLEHSLPSNEASFALAGTLEAASNIFWFFASDPAADGGLWRSGQMSKPPLKDLIRMLEPVSPIILNWPDGLYSWLHAHQKNSIDGIGVRAGFGSFLHRLTRRLPGDQYSFLRNEVQLWLANEWTNGLVKRSSHFFAKSAMAPVLPVKEVSRRLGIPNQRVRALAGLGILEAKVKQLKANRAYLITASSVEDVRYRIAQLISLEEVADRLCISKHQIERLVLYKIIVVSSVAKCLSLFQFEPGEIDHLIIRLRELEVEEPPPSHTISLAEVAQKRQTAFALVTRAVLHGELTIWRNPRVENADTLHRFLISPTGALDWRRSSAAGLPPEPCLSVREAAAKLGLSVRMMPHLVEAGCLRVREDVPARHSVRKRSIVASSVEAFRDRYVMSKELALANKTNTRTVSKILRSQNITPVIMGNTSSGISDVWRRSDCRSLINE